jgi:hypothetical protein
LQYSPLKLQIKLQKRYSAQPPLLFAQDQSNLTAQQQTNVASIKVEMAEQAMQWMEEQGKREKGYHEEQGKQEVQEVQVQEAQEAQEAEEGLIKFLQEKLEEGGARMKRQRQLRQQQREETAQNGAEQQARMKDAVEELVLEMLALEEAKKAAVQFDKLEQLRKEEQARNKEVAEALHSKVTTDEASKKITLSRAPRRRKWKGLKSLFKPSDAPQPVELEPPHESPDVELKWAEGRDGLGRKLQKSKATRSKATRSPFLLGVSATSEAIARLMMTTNRGAHTV